MNQVWPSLLQPLTVSVIFLVMTQATHFRGGTISWKSEGGRKVRFLFKLGWRYGFGPGCTESLIGEYVDNTAYDYWKCLKGCPKEEELSDINYYCTAANKKEDWEQGQQNFTFEFPSDGPFIIGFTTDQDTWLQLSHQNETGHFYVGTTVDLRVRNDTGEVNSSPISLSKPVYTFQFGCENTIHIPVIDPDGDHIRCRWGKGKTECGSVCDGIPGAILNEEKCIVTFNSTKEDGFIESGTYAVALMIEDYPPSSSSRTSSDVMSSTPLQFLVKTTPQQGGGPDGCLAIPRFVPPTPKEMEGKVVEEGSHLEIVVSADKGNDTTVKVKDIIISGLVSLTQSPVTPDVNRPNTIQTTLKWQPSHSDRGDHIVCANVENEQGITGNERCFTIRVVPPGCGSSPCQNHGRCTAVKSPRGYSCICRPQYTGHHCEQEITTTTTTTTTKTTTTSTDDISTEPISTRRQTAKGTTAKMTKPRPSPTSQSTLKASTSTPGKTSPEAISAIQTISPKRQTIKEKTTAATKSKSSPSTTSAIGKTTPKSFSTKETTHKKSGCSSPSFPQIETSTPTICGGDTGSCTVKNYGTCRCIIKKSGNSYNVKDGQGDGLSRQSRDVLAFVFALPLGLALSVLTSKCYDWFQQRRPLSKFEILMKRRRSTW